MDKPIHISILGGGNVATHLARKYSNMPEIVLQQIYNRHLDKILEFKSVTDIIDDLSQLKEADIFIIAINDDAIQNFSKQLTKFNNTLIVHTSGSININDLQVLRKGVFYPFQSFSKDKKQLDFINIPILIEAIFKKDEKLLLKLGKTISNKVLVANSEQRMSLHIGGVFVANFVNHLYFQGQELLKSHKLPYNLLKPLIQEVADKAITMSPKKAQTGPAMRNDQQIIKKHLDFLKDKPQQQIYKLLSDSILNTYSNSNEEKS